MAELEPQSPLHGRLPLAFGRARLAETTPRHITAILPLRGKAKALAAALVKAHGLELPGDGQSSGDDRLCLLWAGRAVYFLIGDEPASPTLARSASLVDLSDGWIRLSLEGEDAAKVLARLCPLDLRPGRFSPGAAARSELRHLSALFHRRPDGFDIMVMRSFACTALDDLRDAMESVAAQNPEI